MDDLLLIPTPGDVERALAGRVRALRRARGWTQAELASRSGLSVATIARFEQAGQGQLTSLLLVCRALGRLRDFDAVLKPPPPRTTEELVRGPR